MPVCTIISISEIEDNCGKTSTCAAGSLFRTAGVTEATYEKEGGRTILDLIHKRLKAGIKSRIICCEGDKNFIEPVEYYRWIEKRLFPKTPWYVYDNKYAIFLWGPPQKVVLIENNDIADAMRDQFLALWEMAKPPDV